MKQLAAVAALLVVVAGAGASDAVPEPSELMGRLRAGHPRLLATAADFTRLRESSTTDPTLKQWRADLKRQADRILKEPPSRYEIPDGKRLLATSRRVLSRVSTLAMMYRLDGERRYVDRAWRELEAAAQFKDWNPRHFLDTAEMTHAFAIGYDWLYDVWTPAQRETLRQAIVAMGLQPARKVYGGKNGPTGWAACHHNWNQVCNGGIGLGALAVGDVEPQLAGEILHAALQSLPLAMAEFAPDGGWGEGPGYWNYATTYNVLFLAGLNSALGTDFGLAAIPGFSKTGDFPVFVSGTTGLCFSFADCHEAPVSGAQLLWLAKRFGRPEWAHHELERAGASPWDLLWYDAQIAKAPLPGLPLDKCFRGPEVVTLRGDWQDPAAAFVGFKAGNKFNHSHLDIGTFAIDLLGQRWAVDLGGDNYNFPGYFGKGRWDYYRLRAEGHNTLVINPGEGPDQDPKAVSKILRFDSQPQRAVAVADLTPAYAQSVSKAWRGVALLNRTQVLVQDEIEAAKPADVYWFMHTKAQIQISADKKTATLIQNKTQVFARILAPSEAVFIVRDATPLPSSPHPEKQGENKAIRKLAVRLPKITKTRIAVLFTPSAADPPVELRPLSAW